MAQNSKFTVQLLEKIGAPLAAAIEAVPLKGQDTDIQSAKLMAQMLGQAVQISISLNGSLTVQEDEAQADSTRLALAALAAPLIADFYEQNEHVPEDQDIKRIIKSLESVLAFAENFSAAEEGKSRLSTIDHHSPLFDKTQTSLVVMQAMTPVIAAVAEFPFGQSEIKLVQDIAVKLENKANDLAQSAQTQDKFSQLLILKALANLYAQCHRAQTQKLAGSTPNENPDNRAELSLDPVWEAFETRTAMIKAVLGVSSSTVGVQSKEPSPIKPAAIPPVTQQVEESSTSSPMGFFKKPEGTQQAAQPVENQQTVPQAENPAVSTEASSSPSSPMGFFKPGAKKADDSAA
ncbi:MAG TPA: hypothetical protein PLK85_04285 [Alphaproteobacteria bacterium]|nr:hypothetical protein [Alphaproteobacteria bacterium]